MAKAAIFLANANDCGDGMAAGQAEASPEASAGGTTFVTSSSPGCPAAFSVTCGGEGSRYDDEVSSFLGGNIYIVLGASQMLSLAAGG